MTDTVLAILMLAVFALVAGAFVMWRRTRETKNPALMLLLAAIAVINVLIWSLPSTDGKAPIDQVKEAAGGS